MLPDWLKSICLYSSFDGLNLLVCDSIFFDKENPEFPFKCYNWETKPSTNNFYRLFLRNANTKEVIWHATLFDNSVFAGNFWPFLITHRVPMSSDQEGLQKLVEKYGLETAIKLLFEMYPGCICHAIIGALPDMAARGDLLTVYPDGNHIRYISSKGFNKELTVHPEFLDTATAIASAVKDLWIYTTVTYKFPCALKLSTVAGRVYIYEISPLINPSEKNEHWLNDATQSGHIDKERGWYLFKTITIPRSPQLVGLKRTPMGSGNGNLPKVVIGHAIFDIDKIIPDTSQILITQGSQPLAYEKLKHISAVISVVGTNTSHAAIIASALGIVYVTGVNGLVLNRANNCAIVKGTLIEENEMITVDGRDGKVYKGEVDLVPPSVDPYDQVLADKKYLETVPRVLSNCDILNIQPSTISDCTGFGLIRTEHLLNEFKQHQHIPFDLYSRQYEGEKDKLYSDLESLHEELILNLARNFPGKSLCFRFFDFLADEIDFSSGAKTVPSDSMLGERGSRLGLLHKGLYESQIRGLLKGAIALAKPNKSLELGLMLPFIAFPGEVQYFKKILVNIIKEFEVQEDIIQVKFGIMLEQPSLYWQLDEIANLVDFISVGTNDLTQLSLGISRNYGNEIIHQYIQSGIISHNPFLNLEVGGTWDFISAFLTKLRHLNLEIKFGICGVHASIHANFPLFLSAGVDYLSVDPNLVTITYKGLVSSRIFQDQSRINQELTRDGIVSVIFQEYFSETQSYLDRLKKGKAQLCAFAWAGEVSKRLFMRPNINWKFFKRDICHRWYGKIEFRRFGPGWIIEDVYEYSIQLGLQEIRLSIFPNDIACHSVSFKLNVNCPQSWYVEIPTDAFGNWIEVFPNRATNDICFRSYYSRDKYYFEFSEGQAMMAFEEQQGSHPVYRIDCNMDITAQALIIPGNGDSILKFLELASSQLAVLHLDLITTLGFSQISVEGYVTDSFDGGFVIVDIDTPFDIAFI